MTVSRRRIFAATGGALALAATAGTWRVLRAPAQARTPWAADGPVPADVRLDVFRHAILAPNPHNRQPWLIQLTGTDGAVIRCDLDRRLPATDPFDRQITIGFGCFLGLARIAAAERGIRLQVTPFPEGTPGGRLDARPVAHLQFVRDGAIAPDPLFGSILKRRSLKKPFDLARIPDTQSLAALSGAAQTESVNVGYSNTPQQVEHIRNLTWDAWMVEAQTRAAFQESVDLMRIGAREVDANPDGISLTGPMIEALQAVGQISREQMADPSSIAFGAGVSRYKAMLSATPAFLWIRTGANTRQDQLAVGESFVRANLAATRIGLGFHPVSQALQEFAEMREPFERAEQLLGGSRVQMLARVGYAEISEPSPRWPLAAKLVG